MEMIEVKYHEIPGIVNIKHLNRYMLQNVSYYYYQWMSGIVPRDVRYISYSRYTWNCQVLKCH